jgi:phage gpG-like protein
MLDINIKIDTKDIDKLLPNIKEGIYKGMKLAMLHAEAQSKKRFNTPNNLHVRTGRLRNSIIGQVTQSGDTYTGSLGTNVIYGPIHENGGVIRAKNAPYLKFQLPNGQWISKKEVSIPSRPFLRPAITENIDRIREIIINSITKEVNSGN